MKVELETEDGHRRVLVGHTGAVYRYGPYLEVGMADSKIDALEGKFHTYVTRVLAYRVMQENTEAKKSS